MRTLRAAIAISTIFIFAACGDSGTGGSGGSGGSSGGSTTGRGGSTGTAGSGSGTAGATGTAGTTGTGGTGSGADCPMCVTCITTNCSSQVATCQASTSCNALYECGRTCTTPINDCVMMHLDAIQVWATVSTCINNNCRTICGL